jgi:hypothetical protein
MVNFEILKEAFESQNKQVRTLLCYLNENLDKEVNFDELQEKYFFYRNYLKFAIIWLNHLNYIQIDVEKKEFSISDYFLIHTKDLNYLINIFNMKFEFMLNLRCSIDFDTEFNIESFFYHFIKIYFKNVKNK